MISMVLVLGLIAVLYFFGHALFIYLYGKTRYKPHLYFSVTALFFALAAVFGMLIGPANSANNPPLIKLFARFSTTLGILAYVFLNMFAVAVTKPSEKMRKMRGVWISVASFLAIMVIHWGSNLSVEGDIGGIPMFTFTSMYKAPYGLPIVETILVLMGVIVVYPTYLFLRFAKDAKYRVIKTSSLLIGIGIIISTTAYAIEITGAIPYQYMPICIPIITVGAYIICFGHLIPRQIERTFAGRPQVSEEIIKSFIEEFFAHPFAPSTQAQPNAFSKTLEIDHQQMIGKKVLFEFDPASSYEKAIQDFAAEASANAEPTVIFTRMGSAIHSSLREQKAVKFFCLTQQVSITTEFSKNEMLLPLKDTSLMLDVFDKTLKVHPEANINVVFDNLSDLVFAIGFEKTYRFIRYTIEMESPRATVLFLLNQTAHNPKVTSSLIDLFSDQISFGKEGIQPVKLSAHALGDVPHALGYGVDSR